MYLSLRFHYEKEGNSRTWNVRRVRVERKYIPRRWDKINNNGFPRLIYCHILLKWFANNY